jgi:hypothetical protein
MKKLLLLVAVVFMTASCEEPERYSGDELYMYSQEFEVLSEDWIPVWDDGVVLYYYYTFRMDRLDNTVCEIGEVSATHFVDGRTQTQLPETLYYFDGASENITFDYSPGEIRFVVSYSDFANIAPDNMVFRVVLNY